MITLLFGSLLSLAMFLVTGAADAQEFRNQSIVVSDTSFPENIGNATFTIRSANNFQKSVDVTVLSGSGQNGAMIGQDLRDKTTATRLSLLAHGFSPQTVTIPIINDTTAEVAETFILRIAETVGSRTHNVTMTIEQNDQGPARTLSITAPSSISGVRVTEGGTQNFTVSLSDEVSRTVTVKCQTLSGGDATAGQDYTAVDDTLTFASGETAKTCSLATIDDAESEADTETVKFGLTGLTGGDIESDGSGGVTISTGHDSFDVSIADNDQPASTLTFPDGSINVNEGVGSAAVRVNLAATRPIVENVTVRCQTAASSTGAVAGEDFTAVNQLLTFTPSDVGAAAATNVTKTCNIPIADDGIDESQEIVSVILAGPTGGATIPNSVNVTIVDNDDAPTVSVAAAEATVSEGTATYDITLNLSAASGKEDVALGYRLTGSANLGDDDQLTPPEAGEDYTVSYRRAGGRSFTAKTVVGTENFFEARTTDGTGQIVIFAGETSKTFTVHVNDDQLKELDEMIVFELVQDPDPAVNQTIANGTSLDDLLVNQNGKTAALTLRSDDAVSLSLQLQPPGETGFASRLRVPEGDGDGGNVTVAFQIGLEDLDESPSTVGVTLRDGTATAGEDYAPLPPGTSPLAVAQGTSPRFEVEILHDEEQESDEYFEVLLGPADAPVSGPFRVFIDDDEGPDPILRETGKYATARAEALIENQPRLITMLRDPDDRSEFDLRVTAGGVDADGGFRAETVWGATTLSRSVDGDREHEHLLTTLGAHFRMSDRLYLGGMLQFDRSGMETGGAGASGEIGGTGWMAGPYFAARDASHPLFFEGRLLYGRSSNDVEDLVLDGGDLRSASFDSERWLAQARVEGTYRLGSGATLIPLADLSHARDEMEPFLASDDPGNPVDGQTIALTKLQIGAELEIPVETARGDLLFRPGLRFVASDASGGAFAGEEGEKAGPRSRGRIDFGIDYRLDGGLVLGFDSFYSGLGRRELESYGAGLDLRLEF